MDYSVVVEALYERHRSVRDAGFSGDAYKPGLDAMLSYAEFLGHPERQFRTIHVAGTNGKGSVCSMLAAALAARGLRVGLYTSPHLVDFRERMKICHPEESQADEGSSMAGALPVAEMISREDVCWFMERYDREGLTFFEVTTGMAFWWFAKERVDVAVIETGLGGRLDSTNIITPELSVITSIGLDHCDLLGSTRAEIAAEKAGIFKPGVPALVWGRDSETQPVFECIAAQVGAPLYFAEDFPAPLASDPQEGVPVALASASQEDSTASSSSFATQLQCRTAETGGASGDRSHPWLRKQEGPTLAWEGWSEAEVPGGSACEAKATAAEWREMQVADNQEDTHYRQGESPRTIIDNTLCISDLYSTLNLDLTGPCQDLNLRTVFAALSLLQNPVNQAEMAAIANAARITGLRGRWEQLLADPLTICDIGHNPPALAANFSRLDQLRSAQNDKKRRPQADTEDSCEAAQGGASPCPLGVQGDNSLSRRGEPQERSGGASHRRPLLVVYGAMRDKDVDDIKHYLPNDAEYYLVQPETPRAMPLQDLALKLKSFNPVAAGTVKQGVQQALERAKQLPGSIVYVGGSTYVVSEAIITLEKK